jgi:acyl-CoA synthetase (AMP-forming)/AMP-acid ligase II
VFRLLAAETTRDLSSLTTVGYASAPIPAPRVAEMIDRFGPIFIQAFGMTETCSLATVLPQADHRVAGIGREGILAYWDDPELTAATYRGGWLRSGDVGYLEEEGYLYLVDRKNDLLIIGGGDRGAGRRVGRAAARGPGAFARARPGRRDDPGALPGPAAHHKAPTGVTILEAMPKTSTGKISKPRLRRLLG